MAAWRDCWGFLSWNCPYFLCDGSWRNSLPLSCRMFTLYSIECLFLLRQVFLSSSVSCFSLLRQVLLFSFHWIFLFSCCRRLCVLSFYRPLLIPCAHLDERTTLDSRLRACFLRPICTFCTLNPWFYCWGVDLFVVSGRWRERIPFPSHLIRWITTICCIHVKGEGEKRKTADARMRVRWPCEYDVLSNVRWLYDLCIPLVGTCGDTIPKHDIENCCSKLYICWW